MRVVPFLVLFVVLVANRAVSFADDANDARNVIGTIERITLNGIVLSTGAAYSKADDVAITLLGGRNGTWGDLRVGDQVSIATDPEGRANSVTITGRANGQNTVLPIIEVTERGDPQWIIAPVDQKDGTKLMSDASIHGHVFKSAVLMLDQSQVTFPNAGNCDVLDAWLGRTSEAPQELEWDVTFLVLGDGNELYRSKAMGPDNQAVHISVPIRGYTGVTFVTKRYGHTRGGSHWDAVVADPTFIKAPSTLPVLVSPGVQERITQDTPMVWKPVRGATGYLLELQCTHLANPADETNENRFVMVRLPANTTVYNFETAKMPKGAWLWRVHALSRTGFLGHTDSWRAFSHE